MVPGAIQVQPDWQAVPVRVPLLKEILSKEERPKTETPAVWRQGLRSGLLGQGSNLQPPG